MATPTESDTTTATILEQLIGVGTAPKKVDWEGYASVLTGAFMHILYVRR